MDVEVNGAQSIASEVIPPGPAFTMLQFNMWGWAGFRGGHEIAHATARCILTTGPAVVTLNEACLGQVEKIKEHLDGSAHTYNFHHDFILHREDNRGACDFGNAIMWKGDQRQDREPEKLLSVPSGEQPRKLMAVRVDHLRHPTVVCVTHLTSGRLMKKTREVQAAEVADYVSRWKARGYEVLLGGDFNEQPGSPVLDPLYLPAYGRRSSGLCHEATCHGEPDAKLRRRPFLPTYRFGRKYDYIFMTEGYLPRGVSVLPPLSDHRPYLATIR